MITYIVFSYNQKEYIQIALESIEKQSVPIDELIISDDGSKDGTKVVIEKFIKKSKIKKIKYLDSENNNGFIHSFNNAIKESIGSYIFIQAGDDYSSPKRTENAINYFNNNKIKVLFTNYKIIDSYGSIRKEIMRESEYLDSKYFIKKGSGLPNYGLAFTRDFFHFFQEIPTNLKNEDDYITMAALLFGGIHVLSSFDYYYRITPNSLSSWSLLENDNDILRKKFYSDQKNRTENYQAWLNLYLRYFPNKKIIYLLKKRISLSMAYERLYDCGIFKRFIIIFKYIELIKIKDFIYLVFGNYSPILIRNLRRIKLKL
jgi:teichuronic acid biosynthesis glycosyltransferase TuaG